MALDVKWWQVNKRKNSTFIPSDDNMLGQWYALLKQDTDLVHPTLEVHIVDGSMFVANYCYISMFERYYFVTGIESIANQQYNIYLEEDVLASFREELKGQSVYLAMSSYDYDVNLDDPRVSPLNTGLTRETVELDMSDIFSDSMTTILAVLHEKGMHNGVDFCIGATLEDYLSKIADLDWWDSLGNSLAGGVNPLGNFLNAWVVPYNVANTNGLAGAQVYALYGESFGARDRVLSVTPGAHTAAAAVPQVPYNDFRHSEKYVEYYLTLPFIGHIPLPFNLVKNGTLQLFYSADAISGDLVMNPRVGDYSLGVYSANLRSDIPIAGAIQSAEGKTATAIASGVVSGATGALGAVGYGKGASAALTAAAGGITGAFQGFASAGGFATNANQSTMGYIGSIGGSVAGYKACGHKAYIHMIAKNWNYNPANFSAIAGRPAQRIGQIKEGYLETVNASIQITGKGEERDMINAFLNGGIYYE